MRVIALEYNLCFAWGGDLPFQDSTRRNVSQHPFGESRSRFLYATDRVIHELVKEIMVGHGRHLHEPRPVLFNLPTLSCG